MIHVKEPVNHSQQIVQKPMNLNEVGKIEVNVLNQSGTQQGSTIILSGNVGTKIGNVESKFDIPSGMVIKKIVYNNTEMSLSAFEAMDYQVGDSLLTVTVAKTTVPLVLKVELPGGSKTVNVTDTSGDTVGANSASFNLTMGFMRNFTVASVNINGTEMSNFNYSGQKLTVTGSIPSSPTGENYVVVKLKKKDATTPAKPAEKPATKPAEKPATGGNKTPATGGDKTPATGGDKTPATGGDKTPATGGDKTPATGGDKTPTTGGTTPTTGGTTPTTGGTTPATGGTTTPATGGTTPTTGGTTTPVKPSTEGSNTNVTPAKPEVNNKPAKPSTNVTPVKPVKPEVNNGQSNINTTPVVNNTNSNTVNNSNGQSVNTTPVINNSNTVNVNTTPVMNNSSDNDIATVTPVTSSNSGVKVEAGANDNVVTTVSTNNVTTNSSSNAVKVLPNTGIANNKNNAAEGAASAGIILTAIASLGLLLRRKK